MKKDSSEGALQSASCSMEKEFWTVYPPGISKAPLPSSAQTSRMPSDRASQIGARPLPQLRRPVRAPLYRSASGARDGSLHTSPTSDYRHPYDMLLNPPRATPSAPAQSTQGPSSADLASPPPTPAARPTPSSLNSHSSYAAVFGPLGAPNTTARIDHILDEAVAPGGDWRARVPAPHLGLGRAQNRARAAALRAMLPLDREKEERRARAELDGRDDDDGAESGGDTAPAPAVHVGPRQPLPRLPVLSSQQNRVRADGLSYMQLPLSYEEQGRRPGAEENGRDAGGAVSGIITAPTSPPAVRSEHSARSGPAAAAGPAPAFERPDVLLEEFCRYYGVNATDQARLARLEFEPGDEIDTLPEDDWKAAGFTTLAWRRIISKNNAFISDSRGGLWG